MSLNILQKQDLQWLCFYGYVLNSLIITEDLGYFQFLNISMHCDKYPFVEPSATQLPSICPAPSLKPQHLKLKLMI